MLLSETIKSKRNAYPHIAFLVIFAVVLWLRFKYHSVSNDILFFSVMNVGYLYLCKDSCKEYLFTKISWHRILFYTSLVIVYSKFFLMITVPFFTGDPQNLLSGNPRTIQEIINTLPITALSVYNEELFKLSTFTVLIAWITLKKDLPRTALAVVIASLIFGGVHYFQWGFTCTIPIFLLSIPHFFCTAYTKSILPSFLAHIITNTHTDLLLTGDKNLAFNFITIFMIYGLVYILIELKNRWQNFNKRPI